MTQTLVGGDEPVAAGTDEAAAHVPCAVERLEVFAKGSWNRIMAWMRAAPCDRPAAWRNPPWPSSTSYWCARQRPFHRPLYDRAAVCGGRADRETATEHRRGFPDRIECHRIRCRAIDHGRHRRAVGDLRDRHAHRRGRDKIAREVDLTGQHSTWTVPTRTVTVPADPYSHGALALPGLLGALYGYATRRHGRRAGRRRGARPHHTGRARATRHRRPPADTDGRTPCQPGAGRGDRRSPHCAPVAHRVTTVTR